MKLLYTRHLPALVLCALVLAAPLGSAVGKEPAVSNVLESIRLLYRERITRISLEILNETKRRTTILGQLDSILTESNALENKKNTALDTSPKLESDLSETEGQLKLTHEKIKLSQLMLTELRQTVIDQPRPTVWQAAMGKSNLPQLQSQAAAHRYLLHTTEKHQAKLKAHHLMLTQRHQTLTDFDLSISDSMGELQGESNNLLNRRKQLEFQLIVLAREIVQKQDHLRQLERRAEKMLNNPAEMHIANLQKKLPDPIEGKLVKRFAEPKAKGLLKWQGILIDAALGQPFSAISDGVVVFANEIQGLGNMVIVDHGEGYMSLYGMAELLLVQTDQLLLAGDPIGTVGSTIGTDTSALYFEFRHNADALNPQDWLEMHRIH